MYIVRMRMDSAKKRRIFLTSFSHGLPSGAKFI